MNAHEAMVNLEARIRDGQIADPAYAQSEFLAMTGTAPTNLQVVLIGNMIDTLAPDPSDYEEDYSQEYSEEWYSEDEGY